ncbi:DegV domain-containing protein CPE0026 [Herbinix luporum]|jgi:DegV family protein with EDD domain|uniref:DegV domain-containing protein CPE0026 n=2 Tax=Herbinix luporum TaxID=1679721 RepID=A0A0K8J3Y3_9FIRM|nr:DegV domain-containing protein CPE0026 [Herbinix luporum]
MVNKMKEFIITTDTTCDLPIEYIEEHNIKVLPLYYSFDNTVYGDKINLDIKEFYDKMRSGNMPTTMAVNPDTARNIFLNLANEGYDILHIAFSSPLSGSCSVAETVARDLMEERPGIKIKVIDSLCASLGEGLLVHKAVMMKKAGKSMDEIVSWLEDNKLNLCHIFTVDDLHHLRRGGRISKTTAIIGSLINVKPILHVNNEGRLVPLNNVRGRKKALISLVDLMEKRIEGFENENDIVFISHGDCLEDANYLASMIKQRLGIENFLINYVSPTIGSHSGPGTIALFFMGNSR